MNAARLRRLTGAAAPIVITAVAVLYKFGLVAAKAVPFNGDEAVVALMARHILQGERPTFFYGQAYLGATDAWLVALSFSIFGENVAAIRVVQAGLFAAFLLTSYLVLRRVGLAEWGARAGLLWLALPPTMLTLYTTATLGGYGETLVLGNVLILMVGDKGLGASGRRWLILGIVAGFGFYTFPLILIYLIPIGLWLLWRQRGRAWRGYLSALVGFIIGSAPWWGALLQSGGRELAELAGAGVAETLPGATYLATLPVRLINFFLFGSSAWWGLRYPWSAEWVLPIVGLAALALYLGALVYAARRSWSGRVIWWGMIGVLLITFLITPFGGDPSGRYFLPLYLPLSVFVAMLLQAIRNVQRTFAALLLAVLIGYNVTGTLIAAGTQPPGITTQFDPVTWIDHTRDRELIDFLLAQGETRGYTNYWVQTPIAFLSREQIISAAALPYHLDFGYTPRDDRYPPYTRAVAEADRAFYITTNHPALDERIRSGLRRLGITYQERAIGNYQVFYALSRKVTPAELGVYDAPTG